MLQNIGALFFCADPDSKHHNSTKKTLFKFQSQVIKFYDVIYDYKNFSTNYIKEGLFWKLLE